MPEGWISQKREKIQYFMPNEIFSQP